MAKTINDIQRSISIGSDPPSDDTDINSGSINVAVTKTNDDFNPTQSQIQERVKFIKRGHESGIMNDTTQSSVVIRHDGQINVSSNRYAQYKLNPSGKVVEQSLESVSLTNRRKISTDDIVLNEHKLNPFLYELTDVKKLTNAYNDNMLVGNFCLFGSVLTFAWEMNLKRYVLIRRPARMPVFSPVLNVPEINTGLGVTDPLKIDEDILAKSTKGYQVNAVVSDSRSLIGKEGQVRYGTNGSYITYGDEGSIGSSSSGGSSGSITLTGNTNAEMCWNFLKSNGFTDEGAAGVIGNLMQESQCNPEVAEEAMGGGTTFKVDGMTGYGIVQWTDASRQQGLLNKAAAMGKPVSDLGVQLAYMKDEAQQYGVWEPCKKATDVHTATKIWHDEYERSNDYDALGGIQNRYDYADDAYRAFGKHS